MSTTTQRDIYHAISDPTRREILSLLAEGPLTLSGITRHFAISRPAVSQQVRVLVECGMVTIKQKGRERFCYPEFKAVQEAYEWLKSYRQLKKKKLNSSETVNAARKKKHDRKSRKRKKGKKK